MFCTIYCSLQSPLNVRLPSAVHQLLRSVDVSELEQRYKSLEAVVQAYNELLRCMSEVDRMLFQHQLQLVDNVSEILTPETAS